MAAAKLSNKLIKEAREHEDVTIRIQSIPPDKLCFATTSDSAWANVKDEETGQILNSQAGYILLACDKELLQGKLTPINMLSWKSHTLKRKAPTHFLQKVKL